MNCLNEKVKGDLIVMTVKNQNLVLERLSGAIRIPTISSSEKKDWSEIPFISFRKYLEQIFPQVHSRLKLEVIQNYSLLYCWEGSNKNLKPVLLMAHMDVVPVEESSRDEWKYSPFEGRIEEGFIWGRGTIDDKSSLLAVLEAFELLLEKNYQPERSIYIAVGHDEELGGDNGNVKIAALLKKRGVRLDFVLDEGLVITNGIIAGVKSGVALVGIAEKGYLNVQLKVRGQGGHSSMPARETAAGILCNAVQSLEKGQMKPRIEGVIKLLLLSLRPYMPVFLRLAISNLWITSSVVAKALAGKPSTNALVRTTSAPTILEGSKKDDVLPDCAHAVINYRILPGDNIQGVLRHVQKTVNDPRVEITALQEVLREPSSVSSVNSDGYKAIKAVVENVFPHTAVAPSLVLAGTDSRHYNGIAENIYRFMPIIATNEDLARIHGVNERLLVENYFKMIEFYRQLILKSSRDKMI